MDTNLSILHHASSSGSNNSNPESAIELQYWAKIERLPTSKRVNKSLVDRKLLNDSKEKKAGMRMVDVTKLGAVEKHMFIDELLKEIEEDNLRLLKKQKERIDRYKHSSFLLFFISIHYLFNICSFHFHACTDAQCNVYLNEEPFLKKKKKKKKKV